MQEEGEQATRRRESSGMRRDNLLLLGLNRSRGKIRCRKGAGPEQPGVVWCGMVWSL